MSPSVHAVLILSSDDGSMSLTASSNCILQLGGNSNSAFWSLERFVSASLGTRIMKPATPGGPALYYWKFTSYDQQMMHMRGHDDRCTQ